MRRLCHAVAALSTFLAASVAADAADLSMPLKAPPLPPPFSWTGFYIGGNFGGAWAHHDWTDSFGLHFDGGNSNGLFIGGLQVGGNYQFNNFVIGAEGTIDWAASDHNTSSTAIVVPAVGGDLIRVTSNDSWIATLAARFGVAFDRALLYGKAGGGWVGNSGFTVADVTTATVITGSSSTASGWLLGAGLEWAFANNFSLKVEYDYLRLNGRTFAIPAGSPFLVGDNFTTGGNNVQMATVGINYRFDWSNPVVARY
jgi:outer membrane immunogenic protein